MSDIFGYDPTSDSLYIKLRPGPSVANRIVSENLIIDLGEDGEPVGYDIQHATKNPNLIAEALRMLQRGGKVAAK